MRAVLKSRASVVLAAALAMALSAVGIPSCKKRRPPAESSYIKTSDDPPAADSLPGDPSPDEPSPMRPSAGLELRKKYLAGLKALQSKTDLARKARSIAILKKEGVPYIEHLSQIAVARASKRRTTVEVALRALSLFAVALRGEGLSSPEVEKFVVKHGIAKALSPKERQFLGSTSPPTKIERTQFVWRYEAGWVMLWALGYVKELRRPDAICNVKRAVGLLLGLLRKHGRAGFIKRAKLRPQHELLDAADLIYRYHWAVRQARLKGKPAPGKLEGGVVLERHHSLNWLIGYQNQAWDDIKTDT